MVKFFDEIPPHVLQWIEKQHMFTVATAPLAADGHVNVSSKGVGGTFHIVNNRKVWYEDLTGSGSETIAHLRENGRITIFFNAFEGPPMICRLFGTGVVHEFATPQYDAYIPPDKRTPGSRSVIVVDVHKVATSCGFAVPFYDFVGHRDTLLSSGTRKEMADLNALDGRGEGGLKAYWENNNTRSIDGLSALQFAHKSDRVADATRDFSRFGVVTRKKGERRNIGGEEMKLMLLAFLFGAIVSAFFARLLRGC